MRGLLWELKETNKKLGQSFILITHTTHEGNCNLIIQNYCTKLPRNKSN